MVKGGPTSYRIAIRAAGLTFCFRVLVCALTLGLVLMARAAVGTEAQDFSLQVTPAAVEIPQGGDATVMILLQNGSSNVLDDVRLMAFGAALFEVRIESSEDKLVLPKAGVGWMARISTKGSNAVSGNVYFRVDFSRRAKTGETNSIPVTAVAPVAITTQAPQPIGEIAEIKIETTGESLNEKRPGTVHVIIKNKANVPLMVDALRIKGPGYLTIEQVETNLWPHTAQHAGARNLSQISLKPFESRAMSYRMIPDSRVTPGKQFLVIEAPLSWEKGGYSQSGVVTTTQQIEIGIFGESAILAALGIPTFLFLPGFLMLATFGLCYNFRKTDAEKASYPLKGNTTDFYVVAITLSIVAFAVYPFLSKAFTSVPRDILGAYGVSDVAVVWLGSVLVGSLAFLLLRIALWIGQIKERRRRAYEFSTDDDEIEFLRKLAVKRREIVLERINLTLGSNTDTAFVIEKADAGKWWVAPFITLKWTKSGSGTTEAAVTKAIDAGASAAAILHLLESDLNANAVDLDWKPTAIVTKLQKVDEANLGTQADQQPILEIV